MKWPNTVIHGVIWLFLIKYIFFRVRKAFLSSLTQSCQSTDILLWVGNRRPRNIILLSLALFLRDGTSGDIWEAGRWGPSHNMFCARSLCRRRGGVGRRMCLIQIDIRLPVILIVFITITYEPSSVPKHIHNNLFVFFFVLIIQIENF